MAREVCDGKKGVSFPSNLNIEMEGEKYVRYMINSSSLTECDGDRLYICRNTCVIMNDRGVPFL